MFYLEAFEDRLLMSSMMSIAPLDVGQLPISPGSAGNPGSLPVLNASLFPIIAPTQDPTLNGLPVVNLTSPVTPVGSITGLEVLDLDNNQSLGSLTENETLDLGTLPTQHLALVATSNGQPIGSVVFGFDGNTSAQVSNTAPYEFSSWSQTLGSHTVTVTPYSGANGSGASGTTFQLDFSIANSTAVTGLELVDADNGQPIEEIPQWGIIDLGTLPTQNLTIVPELSSTAVGSVVFGYDNNATYSVQNTAPFALDFFSPTLGSHSLTATPYSAANGGGAEGIGSGINFDLIDTVPVSAPTVTGFSLIDTDTGQTLRTIADGDTIDMAILPTQDLSIIANTNSGASGSIVFSYDGNSNFDLENNAPYQLPSWTPTVGSHTIIATPYSGSYGTGVEGTPQGVSFTVVNSNAVVGFNLIDTMDGHSFGALTEGETIDLASLPTQDLALVAIKSPNMIGSVVFGYDSNSDFDVDSAMPFALSPWTPTLGPHTITATPYSATNGNGFAGSPLSVDFTIINSSDAAPPAAVTGFTLIDTDNGHALGTIEEGDSVDLAMLPTTDLAIVANMDSGAAGSVEFGYDGNPYLAVENTAPFELASWTPTVGSHTITATSYTGSNATGFAADPLSVDFTVVNSDAIIGFNLLDADNGQSLGALTQGSTINLATLPTQDLSIVAIKSPNVIGSVVFNYDGTPDLWTANRAPYEVASWTPTVGPHSITATPYSAGNAAGVAGVSLTIEFTVINPVPAVNPVTNDPAIAVSITNPTNGESQAGPGYYVIRTSTSDTSGPLSEVDFYVNGNLLGKVTAQPFSLAWENATPGSYVLTALASDGTGSTASAPVNVTITQPVVAQTIYVNANGGSDSNNGLSLGAPFKTISAAANIAQPGDTILIEPGTYRETVVVPNSGTATNPITFQAAVPGTVIIDGADPLGGWTATKTGSNPIFTTAWTYNFFHNGSRYFFGLSTDGTTTTVGYAEQFLYNNKPLTQVLTLASMVAGDFYINYTAGTVSVWLPGGATPSSSNILASTRSHLFVPASASVKYIRVDGIIFQHAANFAQDGAVQTATAWRITDSTIQSVNSSAIEIRGNDVLIYNDHALNNGNTGFDGSGTNDLMLDDETAGNNYKGFSVFNEAGGGKFAQSDGEYFDNYYAHNNIGPGLWFDYNNTNYVVVNSYFYDNKPRVANYEGVGLMVEISQGPGRIQNNTFYGNTGAALGLYESMNITVTNNSFENSYVELRDLPNRAPYHIQNIQITANEFDNSSIDTSSGTWTTTSAATKQIYINDDTYDDSGPLVYWNGSAYNNLSTIANTLGIEENGLLGILTFAPAPSVV